MNGFHLPKRKLRYIDIRPIVTAGHVAATWRDRLSLPMAGTSDMTLSFSPMVVSARAG